MADTQAFVTLATTDVYCMGSLVVGKSLRRHGTLRKLVVMVTPNVTKEARLPLEDVFDEVVMVDVLDSRDRAHLSWLGRPELGVTFTKLHCWTLTQYSKCVFLDADTLVLCNVDELFDYEEFSAAPDPGWPDCFNSGVFVFRPSLNTYTKLLEHTTQHGSFDGGDQGVLNTFFSDWAVKDIRKHLPFVYNVTASAIYTYLPAYHQYGHQAKIIHFLGATKPWHFSYNSQEANESSLKDSNKHLEQFINLWWEEYYSQTQLQIKKDDKNEDTSIIQHSKERFAPQETSYTPSQMQKSSSEAHHREISPSQPALDLTVDPLTISSSHIEIYLPRPPTDLTVGTLPISSSDREISSSHHPIYQALDTPIISSSQNVEETNIPFKVLSGDEAAEISQVSPLSGQQSDKTSLETADDSTATAGEAESDIPAEETEEENLEHRRMWEEGHVDYMGKDAFDNIKRKLDRFLH